ncbi:MAG: TetR/AcrR family transcriptional regulator [Deltaproteobacteria bacterium]|nr:TetR/AcrR family transcriptional regulator [Deltaproteobacteria bacterium]
MDRKDTRDTAGALLDAAQSLVQSRGFNAFSYKDLAREVGIRTASIHYHFPSKGDLGEALMGRYLAGLEARLQELDDVQENQLGRLKGFIEMYRETENQGAICLCGSMASDLETLPAEVHQVVRSYLEKSQGWVEQKIMAGIAGGEFSASSTPQDLAATLVASLQGALLMGRAGDGASVLDRVQRSFLSSLKS